MITPLWNARDFGLGAGAELGWKSPLIGGDVWFTRFPVLATVHVLARVHKAWYLKLDAGVEKDLHCRLSRGSGHAEVNLQGNTGLVGEIGLCAGRTPRCNRRDAALFPRALHGGPDEHRRQQLRPQSRNALPALSAFGAAGRRVSATGAEVTGRWQVGGSVPPWAVSSALQVAAPMSPMQVSTSCCVLRATPPGPAQQVVLPVCTQSLTCAAGNS